MEQIRKEGGIGMWRIRMSEALEISCRCTNGRSIRVLNWCTSASRSANSGESLVRGVSHYTCAKILDEKISRRGSEDFACVSHG